MGLARGLLVDADERQVGHCLESLEKNMRRIRRGLLSDQLELELLTYDIDLPAIAT